MSFPSLVKNKVCDFALIDSSTDQLIHDLPVMCCAVKKKKSDAEAPLSGIISQISPKQIGQPSQ